MYKLSFYSRDYISYDNKFSRKYKEQQLFLLSKGKCLGILSFAIFSKNMFYINKIV